MQVSPIKALAVVSILPLSLALLQAAGVTDRSLSCAPEQCNAPSCLAIDAEPNYPLPSVRGSKIEKAGLAAIHGRIQYVDSFPDYKVKAVDAFEDLAVQIVTSFPDAPGKWQIVDSFPDYKIQMVDSFPDFTVKFVDSFPGVR